MAIVDDLESIISTDAEGNEKEVIVLTYSCKNGRYGKITLPKKSLEKHLPNVKAGDKILKYRGNSIPKMARQTTTKEHSLTSKH